jgi:hypothetical protein
MNYPLLATTLSIVTALVAARDAGIKVPQKVIDRGIKYIENCANRGGGFRYTYKPHGILTRAHLRSRPSITGCAILPLLLCKKDSEKLKPGIDCLKKRLGFLKAHRAEHYWFHLLFGSMAAYRIGGDLWERWQEKIEKKLAFIQKKKGYWKAVGYSRAARIAESWGARGARKFLKLFATTIGVFILQLDKGKLNFLERR